jgi:hypothetical protein
LSKPVPGTVTTINVDSDLNHTEVNSETVTGRDLKIGGSLNALDISRVAVLGRNPGSGAVDTRETGAWASRTGLLSAILSLIGTGTNQGAKTTGIRRKNLVTAALVETGVMGQTTMRLPKETMKDTNPGTIPPVSGHLSASDIEARVDKIGHRDLHNPSDRSSEVHSARAVLVPRRTTPRVPSPAAALRAISAPMNA